MKTVKFKQRVNNAVDAFFDAENSNENNLPAYRWDSTPLQNNRSADPAEKGDSVIKILKRTCLFFPGTFILFFLSFGIPYSLITARFRAGTPFSGKLLIALFYFLASLMTWYGIGELKNQKHIVIPLSISITGMMIGVVSGMLPADLIFMINRNDSYLFYFLPAALVVPFLAKGFVDRHK